MYRCSYQGKFWYLHFVYTFSTVAVVPTVHSTSSTIMSATKVAPVTISTMISTVITTTIKPTMSSTVIPSTTSTKTTSTMTHTMLPTTVPKEFPAVVPSVTVDNQTVIINGDNVTLTLSWEEPFNNLYPIVNYTVSCSGDVTCPPDFTTADNTTRDYTITNLTPMTNYIFSVVATNSIGSGKAGVVMITTPPGDTATANLTTLSVGMTTTTTTTTTTTATTTATTTTTTTSSVGMTTTTTSSVGMTTTTTTTTTTTSSVGMITTPLATGNKD